MFPHDEQNEKVYSYKSRYVLKKEDSSKKRFCEDVMLSKEYENLLKDYAHLLVRNIEIYFDSEAKRNS